MLKSEASLLDNMEWRLRAKGVRLLPILWLWLIVGVSLLSFSCLPGADEAIDMEAEATVAGSDADEADASISVLGDASSIADVVDAVSPAIVRVVAKRTGGDGIGTGIVYNTDGYVVTSWHVVSDASGIEVTTARGATFRASIVREDPALDLALLLVVRGANDDQELIAAEFGDSDQLRVGDDVVAIGHAFGFSGQPSVSRGIVSGLDRAVADPNGRVFSGLIQTDAAISQGSSGGALVNGNGEIVGMSVGLINLDERLNLAFNANAVVESAGRLAALGMHPLPGYLGVGGTGITPYIAERRALPVGSGFEVRYVDPDSPAAAGLLVEDVIVKMNSTPIRSRTDFAEFLRNHPKGTDVVVTTVRKDGDDVMLMEIPITLTGS